MKKCLKKMRRQRVQAQESFSFNWGLTIPQDMQWPFEPSHDNMSALALHREQPVHQLVSELRKAFSGLVAGNVKEAGVRAVAEHGPYQLRGDPELVASLGTLLENFAAQGRMKIEPDSYRPCFELGS